MRAEELASQKGYYIDNSGLIFKDGHKLNGVIDIDGYLKFNIKDGKRYVKCKAHRLQAYQKYGIDLYKPGIVVRHLNNIKTDNSSNNIVIGTQKENALDNPKEMRIYLAKMASLQNGKRYPLYLIAKIKADRSSGLSYGQIMSKYGISSKGTVSYICNHEY